MRAKSAEFENVRTLWIWKGLWVVLFLLFVVACPLLAADATKTPKTPQTRPFVPDEPILPLAKIEPGMRGRMLTVVEGRKVVAIPVTILAIEPQKGSPKNLILIRAEGPIAEKMGVAAGMSGSPVYVGDKLIGALGYGFPFQKGTLALVTPIEDMVKALDWRDRVPAFTPARIVPTTPISADAKKSASADKTASADLKEAREERKEPKANIVSGDLELAASADIVSQDMNSKDIKDIPEASAASKDVPDAKATPFFASGLGVRGGEMLGRNLGREVVPMGGAMDSRAPVNLDPSLRQALRPGSAIAALLAWGDVQIGAIGTLSAVGRDGRFLAFGHPFMQRGAVAYPIADANIVQVVSNVNTPFKIGTPRQIVGTITQDRAEAVGGVFGKLAPAVSCRVWFRDLDTNRNDKIAFQVISDPFILANVTTPALLGGVENMWGRIGEGTARVRSRFSGGAMPGGWERTNMFFSERDLASEMLREFNILSRLLSLNQYQEIRPFGMDVWVEMSQTAQILYIEKLEIQDPKKAYAAGDKLTVKATLRPWRRRAFVKTYELRIPEKYAGYCEVLARGGGIEEEGQTSLMEGLKAITNLNALLRELEAAETNNMLVLEIRGAEAGPKKGKEPPSPEDLIDDRLGSEIRQEKLREGSMRVFKSNYYVEGILRKVIRVDPPGGAKGAGAVLEEVVVSEDKPAREDAPASPDEPPGVEAVLEEINPRR